MLDEKKALLLIGSPKYKNSTSESLGNYLLQNLHEKGYICDKLHILTVFKNDIEELLSKVNDTDLLIISFPLYVDSLPSPLIRALELIGENRREKRNTKKQRLIAIANNGFPESFHNYTALNICKNFADKAGFQWLGGFAVGSGAAINGRPIEQLGGMTRNKVAALDMAVEAIAKDSSIPPIAFELMSSKLIPTPLYTFIANQGWKVQSKKFEAKKELYAKPYLKPHTS